MIHGLPPARALVSAATFDLVEELVFLLCAARDIRAMLLESSLGGKGWVGASAPMEEAVYEGRPECIPKQGEK
jgi:hypothetical protein